MVIKKEYSLYEKLSRAVMLNDIENIKKCITAGADVNEKDSFGVGLLRFSPSIETAKLLVENGLDVYTLDIDGVNGLYAANIHVVKYLDIPLE